MPIYFDALKRLTQILQMDLTLFKYSLGKVIAGFVVALMDEHEVMRKNALNFSEELFSQITSVLLID
jgi:hypothetical protein